MSENIIQVNIKDEIEQSLLDYGMSIISDRALPSAEDGLKPVNRRILYDMFDKGFMNNKKFVKCAQPVGDTMGRFHPHGDSSIYGALVWMSQEWNMRYPLISWHGNNGSRDGDEPAAYRYTECKLSKLGEEMLADIKKNTVDWMNAYTDEEQEPIYLPGRIPNLIVNGTSGIAWAMACSFAPHNLSEVMDAAIYLLENPECDIRELLNYIKGPDFPTGGLLINKDELETAYLTGKGRARLRGEYTIESSKSGDSIVFTSIPYKVSKETLTVEIDKLCEEGELNGVTAIRDESNRDGVRFVIELGKGISAAPIIAKLFKSTRLEDTYSFNQVALVDKKPRLLNIKQLLENYIEHQKDVLLRKTKFDIEKVQARIHILEGLLIALEDIDNITAGFKDCEYIEKSYISNVDTSLGEVTIQLDAPNGLYNQILNDIIGTDITSKAKMLSMFQELNEAKVAYDQIKGALKMVKQTGYGIAAPTLADMKLETPEIIKQGPRYGVKLKAKAPSIHMIKVDVESTFEPIIGSELQSKELIEYLTKDANSENIWKSEIFGRSLDVIVQEGIQAKLSMMPDNIRYKLGNTLTKVINKGSNNMIAIVL